MALIAISGKMGAGKDTVGKMIQYLAFKDRGYEYEHLDVWLNKRDTSDEGREIYSGWKIKKMGYKLKQIASILLNVPVEKFEYQEYKKQTLDEEWWYYNVNGERKAYDGRNVYPNKLLVKPTVRQLLQEIGTEAMRDSIHPHIWSNALFADYKPIKEIIGESSLNVGEVDIYYPNWIITDIRFPNEAQAVKDRDGILIRVNRTTLDTSILPETLEELRNPHPSETGLDNWKDWDFKIDNNGTLEDLLEKVKLIYEEINE